MDLSSAPSIELHSGNVTFYKYSLQTPEHEYLNQTYLFGSSEGKAIPKRLTGYLLIVMIGWLERNLQRYLMDW